MRLLLFISLACFMAPFRAKGQTGYNNIWFHYVSKNMLTKKWSFTFEGTLRFANGFSQRQQYFLRPSIDRKFTEVFTASLGFSHYNTYRYGDPPMFAVSTAEEHLWLQGQWSHTLGKIKFTHRLRDENRFIGPANIYRNRLRYMLLATIPITKKEDKIKCFAVIGDEAFLNVGKFSGATLFNQNRAILGLGYNFSSAHQMQLNFIHQTIWNFSNTLIENNPTLRISYIQNLSWIKTK